MTVSAGLEESGRRVAWWHNLEDCSVSGGLSE